MTNTSSIIDQNGMNLFNGTYPKSNGGTETMYRRLDQWIMTPKNYHEKFQVICSRVRNLEPDKYHILYLHDMVDDPETLGLSRKDFVEKIDYFVFVSVTQMQEYLSRYPLIPIERTCVIKNCFDIPEAETSRFDEQIFKKFDIQSTDETIRFIYHTTPHRGLPIAVDVFCKLKEDFPDQSMHFDIFSSFNAYGWKDRDEQYRELFDFIDKHPDMTNHGFVERDVLNKYLFKAHAFLFPSIWKETSCMAMIESNIFGVIPLYSNLGALPETASGLGLSYPPHTNHKYHQTCALANANLFVNLMKRDHEFLGDMAVQLSNMTNYKYHRDMFIAHWSSVFTVLQHHPILYPEGNL